MITKHGQFIKKAYSICTTYLEQKVPRENTIREKFELIKYALFSNDYNHYDRLISDIEKSLEKYYSTTLTQNQIFYQCLILMKI